MMRKLFGSLSVTLSSSGAGIVAARSRRSTYLSVRPVGRCVTVAELVSHSAGGRGVGRRAHRVSGSIPQLRGVPACRGRAVVAAGALGVTADVAAAAWIASRIRWYVAQRHRLPFIAAVICASVGEGFLARSAA